MNTYTSHNSSKGITLEETEYFDIDSARLYLENSIVYQHARLMPEDNNPFFYNFYIGYYTKYINRMTMDDVNEVYNRAKDSLHNYLENLDYTTKQLTDVIIAADVSGNSVRFKITSVFGTVSGNIPFFDYPENITFSNIFPTIPKWHWSDPQYKDQNNTIQTFTNANDRAFVQYKNLFWERLQLTIYSSHSNTYMWIKDVNNPISISTNQIYIGYGPPSSHYFPNFPLSVTGLLGVAYFTGGSNNFATDNEQKTWLTLDMLDYYLANFITLSNQNAPSSSYKPWEITSNNLGNTYYNSYPTEYLPSCNGYPNYLNYSYWRRWNLALYYAQKTTIILPPVTPI